MTLDILLSCMNQEDASLIQRSHITGSAVVINQCNREDYREFPTDHGEARMFFTKERGLTRSRNMAVRKSKADICLLCDDDEVFVPGYEEGILKAYQDLPQADIIAFKMTNQPSSLPDRVMELKFPKLTRVSSWQISFRREALLRAGVEFDELMGAGTGNGAEEELKFLMDCRRAGLRIFYVPFPIAEVDHVGSTWFAGYNKDFFYNRGATTRYILGAPLAAVYAVYYVVKKRKKFSVSAFTALKEIFRGMKDNKIVRQQKQRKG